MDDPNRTQGASVQIRIQSSGGLLGKLVTAIIAGAMLVAAVFLSVFLFAGMAVLALVAGGWLWWRTRRIRRELRATLDAAERRMAEERRQADGGSTGTLGDVIDGDFIRTKSPGAPTLASQETKKATDRSP